MRIASVRRRMRDERLDKSNHYLGECDCRYRACLLFIQGATNMMTKEEIMKVLDAMNYAISPSGTFWVKKHNEAKQILQAALAEPSEATTKRVLNGSAAMPVRTVPGTRITPKNVKPQRTGQLLLGPTMQLSLLYTNSAKQRPPQQGSRTTSTTSSRCRVALYRGYTCRTTFK